MYWLDMGEPSSRTFKHGDNLIKWLTSKIHFFYLNFQRNPSEYFEANILMKNIELTSNVRWVNLQVCSTFNGQHTKPVWGCLSFFHFLVSFLSLDNIQSLFGAVSFLEFLVFIFWFRGSDP